MIARYCSMLALSTGGFRLITCTMCHSRPARRRAASSSRLSGPVASTKDICLIQGMIRVGAKIERAARAGKARSLRPCAGPARRPNLDRMPPLPLPPPLVARAWAHADRTAIIAADGTFTYRELLDASARVATCLLAGRADLAEARVAFLAPAGFRHVATQWGIWRAGGVAVPLPLSHPPPELEYVIPDAEAELVVVPPDLAGHLEGGLQSSGRRPADSQDDGGATPPLPPP